MKTSQNGINLIKKYEGCKLESYKCQAGVWTIGWGHTGADVTPRKKITQSEADALLVNDLVRYECKVNKYNDLYHFTQNQFDALISFAFNIGSIDQLTRNGKRTIDEIAKAMPMYNKAGGKVLAGLTKRREAEKALFTKNNDTLLVYVKGEPVEVCAVNIDGHNYIKLRDIEKISNVKITYNNGKVIAS